jgi:hypothetical protein
MFCANCGSNINDDAVFCPSCGKSVKAEAVTANAGAGKPGIGLKGKLEQLTGNRFFAFSRPYLVFLDKGKILSLVYYLMAVINVIIPFKVLFSVIDSGFFNWAGLNFVLALILSWAAVVFACFIGFQLWWERREKVKAIETSQFVATVIFSEIVQTFGEWLGTMIGIVGAGIGLFGSIFLGDIDDLLSTFGLGFGFMQFGIALVLIAPISGFFIIALTRFLAEQIKLLTSLVNNAKEIAVNCKEIAANRENNAIGG